MKNCFGEGAFRLKLKIIPRYEIFKQKCMEKMDLTTSFESAFEDIYGAHYRKVYTFLYKLCHDARIAEELTQETFYKAYLLFGSYNGKCEVLTWLLSLAKNVFFEYLRRRRYDSILIDLYVTRPEAPITDDPGYRLSKKLRISKVLETISEFPKNYTDVLILRIYGELPYGEIAAKLKITENSAKTIFARARKLVKEKLIK